MSDQQTEVDVPLAPLDGEARPLPEWLTTFQLVTVALDPFTYESGWIIDTAARVLRNFEGADCRVGWIVTGTADEARQFLGPWADEMLTFVDPDRGVVKALGVERLPTLLHVRQDASVADRAEGWQPREWEAVAEAAAEELSWNRPLIPDRGDPAPYDGTPV